jgi:hypothetical protein
MKTSVAIMLFLIDSPIVTLRYQTLIFFGAGWRF